MEFLANDIIRFKNLNNELNGVIKAVLDKTYYIHGLNGKEYKINKSDIIESVGKARINEARGKAETWQRDK